MFKSVSLDAIMSGVFSVFPKKPLWSGFCTSPFGPCPEDQVIKLTVTSTLGVTRIFNPIKITSKTWLSTAAKTLSASLLILSNISFSVISTLLWQSRQVLYKSSDWTYGYFNSSRNHSIHCHQSRVTDSLFDGNNNTIRFFTNSVNYFFCSDFQRYSGYSRKVL